jgi:hypothetical protein
MICYTLLIYLFHENNGIEFVSSVNQLLLMEAQQLAHTYQSMMLPHPTTKEIKTLKACGSIQERSI